MKLVRKIGNKNRINIPSDVLLQTGLKEGDAVYIDIVNINGYPTITMRGDKSYEEIRRSNNGLSI